MASPEHPPAFAVVGWKNSGKTTLVERLVSELTRRGFAVGTVKHTHEAFLMDHNGTDTDRHRRAGAKRVAMMGPNGWTLAAIEPEPDLAAIMSLMETCDIVVAEGFKGSDLPKIEVVADPQKSPIRADGAHVFAVASDLELDCDLPLFRRDDVVGLTDLALQRIGLA